MHAQYINGCKTLTTNPIKSDSLAKIFHVGCVGQRLEKTL
jgi:hypothetical protein